MPPQHPGIAAVLPLLLLILLMTATTASGQQIGTIPEVHPNLPTQFCTKSGGCVEKQTKLVTDSLSHPMHVVGDASMPCTAAFNTSACADAEACSRNCVIEGVDYGSLGVSTQGTALTMRQYLFNGTEYKSVSPRLYLLAEDGMNYEMLKLVNQELTYDVDLSRLGCGMNGALYFSEMEASGSRSAANPAGAQFGTGYCDAQCFTTVPFINGIANLNGSGSCCNEMDVWEANSMATVYTPHTCSKPSSFLCTGDECGRGDAEVCDKNGCGLNPYKHGSKSYYGPGLTVDTAKPFTVITQFVHEREGSDIATAGALAEITRMYIQDGRLIENVRVTVGDNDAQGAGVITQDFCDFHGADTYTKLGGMKGMGESMARGMVLIFSIWNSPGDFMSWLDQGESGPCSATAGDPAAIVRENPDVAVTFSNIKWGELGTTYSASAQPAQAQSVPGGGSAQVMNAGAAGAPVMVSTALVTSLVALAAGLLML